MGWETYAQDFEYLVSQAFGVLDKQSYDYYSVHKTGIRDAIMACRDDSYPGEPVRRH